VLHAVSGLLFEINDTLLAKDFINPGILFEVAVFLTELGFIIGPPPKNPSRILTRKIDFSDATQGSAATRAVRPKHLAIARRVHELQKAGAKAPVRTTADEFNMESSAVSRICADPYITNYLQRLEHLGFLT
jgi:hypothetical protein